MAILKECQECGSTFYGEKNICLNCREKKRDDDEENIIRCRNVWNEINEKLH